MAEITSSEARAAFSTAFNRVCFGKERITVRRRGHAVAIIPIEDLELLEDLEDRWLIEEADKAEADSVGLKRIPLADIKARPES